MGWDAFAEPFNWYEQGDPEYISTAKAVVGPVDGLLKHGGLDCSVCAMMLQRAVKDLDCWSDRLTPDEVRAAAKRADWSFECRKDEQWAKDSARAFLERTAELGRGIRFSY